MDWQPQEDLILADAWAVGHPASHIGRLLGRTKNSVIGRAKRIGVVARPRPILPKKPPKPERPARMAPEPVIRPYAKVKTPAGGAGTCQWIEGSPTIDDACKCGQPALAHSDGRRSSWCSEHLPRIYTKRPLKVYGQYWAPAHRQSPP